MSIPKSSKIVFVTSGQPSLNPRLVKEADSLAALGYDVLVLYAYWNHWGALMDKAFLASKTWRAICVGGDPNNKPVVYFLSRLIHKFSAWMAKAGLNYFNKYALARSSFFLEREARKHLADLYIGHNLGALPAIFNAAKKNNAKCGFDAEDLHRYETSDDDTAFDVKLKSYIEEKYIPSVDYLTTSSPQITDIYCKFFPDIQPVTILNAFPVDHKIQAPVVKNSPVIKLLWISQTIGNKRGLEDVIQALHLLKQYNLELHLLGYHTAQTKIIIESINTGLAKIVYHEPVPPDALSEFASAFDIGLALEPGFSLNNNNALSNKIFTYLQAGLTIIASDTAAQKAFLENYPAIGKSYPKGDIAALANLLLDYCQNRKNLYESGQASWQLARNSINWEKESEKFIAVVKQTLNSIE